jgi:hypothetical protein
MPKVRFIADFNFARERVTVAYKAGMKVLVTTPCAKEAIAKGRAVPLEPEEKAAPAPIRRRK